REQWEKDIAHTLTNTEQVVVKLGNQRSLYDQWTQWDIGIPGTQEVDEALSSLFNTSNEESRRQQVQSWNEYEVQLFRFFAQVILDKFHAYLFRQVVFNVGPRRSDNVPKRCDEWTLVHDASRMFRRVYPDQTDSEFTAFIEDVRHAEAFQLSKLNRLIAFVDQVQEILRVLDVAHSPFNRLLTKVTNMPILNVTEPNNVRQW